MLGTGLHSTPFEVPAGFGGGGRDGFFDRGGSDRRRGSGYLDDRSGGQVLPGGGRDFGGGARRERSFDERSTHSSSGMGLDERAASYDRYGGGGGGGGGGGFHHEGPRGGGGFDRQGGGRFEDRCACRRCLALAACVWGRGECTRCVLGLKRGLWITRKMLGEVG